MPATDIIPASPRDAVISPLDTGQVKAAMSRYQDGLQSILEASDWQQFVDKKTGEPRRFLKRAGWRKIAFWFGLDLEVITSEVERDPQGNPLRARVIARATHPNGRRADGDGYCSIRERGFSKPENDIPATAATRAMNRAISNLVGMGEVSAEEVEGEEPAAQYGPPASNRELDGLYRAVEGLYDTGDHVLPVLERLERDAGSYTPRIVARAVMLVAAHRPTPNTGVPPAAKRGEAGVDDRPENTPDPGASNTPSDEVTATTAEGPPDDQRAM